MQCRMCNNSYCSCKSSCSSCHLDNNIIYFINDVIKNWLTPAQAKENKEVLSNYYKKIDALTMKEYLLKEMDEEKFQEAVASYEQDRNKKAYQKSEVVDVSDKVNPWEECVYPEWADKAWGRCMYCNRVIRYAKWTPCPRRKSVIEWETPGSTDTKN